MLLLRLRGSLGGRGWSSPPPVLALQPHMRTVRARSKPGVRRPRRTGAATSRGPLGISQALVVDGAGSVEVQPRAEVSETSPPPPVSPPWSPQSPWVRVCHRDVSKTLQMLPPAAAQTLGEAPWDLVSAAGRVRSCLTPCQSLQGPWGGGLRGLRAPRPSEGTRAVPASGVPQRHRASCLCSPTTP